MQRYFLPPEQIDASYCWLMGDDAHHIKRVMRYRPGERIICCDGSGRSYLAEINEIDADKVVCQVIDELDESREMPLDITIAQALPKGDKMDWILQKGTELGAARFIPFVSSRTIVKYNEDKMKKKNQRWQKIIKEAAEQAHRQRLPVLEDVVQVNQLTEIRADCKLVADEEASLISFSGASSFVHALEQQDKGKEILVAIGPEGGFSRDEIEHLIAGGFTRIALGPRILRTETAAQYVLAAISFYYEQMGG